MVQTRRHQTTPEASKARPSVSSKERPSLASKERKKAFLVKLGSQNVLCTTSEQVNHKSRSILVTKLNTTESQAKFVESESIKINPKSILKEIEVTNKGKFYSVAKKHLKDLESLQTKEIVSEDESFESNTSEEITEKKLKKAAGKRKGKESAPNPVKKLKIEAFKKGKNNPKIQTLAITKDLMDPSSTPRFSVSISNNNKNVHRAVSTDNKQL